MSSRMIAGRTVLWLARRHDLAGFLKELHFEVDRSGDPQVQALKPAIAATLAKLS